VQLVLLELDVLPRWRLHLPQLHPQGGSPFHSLPPLLRSQIAFSQPVTIMSTLSQLNARGEGFQGGFQLPSGLAERMPGGFPPQTQSETRALGSFLFLHFFLFPPMYG
jgi:hypothetical protein